MFIVFIKKDSGLQLQFRYCPKYYLLRTNAKRCAASVRVRGVWFALSSTIFCAKLLLKPREVLWQQLSLVRLQSYNTGPRASHVSIM